MHPPVVPTRGWIRLRQFGHHRAEDNDLLLAPAPSSSSSSSASGDGDDDDGESAYSYASAVVFAAILLL